MKALIIYDYTGYIWNIVYGVDKEPEGLLCMWVDIPEDAQITKIDVSDPSNHVPVFTYNDNSDIKKIQEELAEVKKALNPTFDATSATLEETKDHILECFSQACSSAIFAGQEVDTSKGTFRFSFNHNDQINLKEAFDLVYMTGLDIPYHADKVDCTMWSALDIVKIYGSNVYAKTYQTTYCNLLNNICRALDDKNAVINMYYGMELPDAQNATLNLIMIEAKKVFDRVMADFIEKFQTDEPGIPVESPEEIPAETENEINTPTDTSVDSGVSSEIETEVSTEIPEEVQATE